MGLLNLVLELETTTAQYAVKCLMQLANGTISVQDIAKEFAQCCLDTLTAPDAKARQVALAHMQKILADLDQ